MIGNYTDISLLTFKICQKIDVAILAKEDLIERVLFKNTDSLSLATFKLDVLTKKHFLLCYHIFG